VPEAVRVAFLGSEAFVPVPGANNAVPFTVSQRQFLAELTVPIIVFLNRGSHVMYFHFDHPT
jgi:hypothetical protein